MKKKRVIIIVVTALLVLIAVTGGLYLGWKNGLFLPGWISWESRNLVDEESGVQVKLEKKTVQVYQGDSLIWTSPRGVKVQDVLFEDIDHDGSRELILLCWKIGKYGIYRPFWEEKNKDDRTWSQHIFIYDYRDEQIHQQWLASDIGIQVVHWSFTEEQFLRLEQTDQVTSYWTWLSWGLQFIKRE